MATIYDVISVLEHCSNGFCDGCPLQEQTCDMAECFALVCDFWRDFRHQLDSVLVYFDA